MQFNKVEICGVNTAKLKVLKESEKMELLHRIKQGDMKARDELISGQPTAGAQRNTALCQPRGKPGRPVSSGMHWAD